MGFKLQRVRYHAENQLAVEICSGTKHVSEDVLKTRYKDLGESKYLVSPDDAVSCAIRIMKRWNLDYHDELKKISFVNSDGTGGKLYFDPYHDRDVRALTALGQKILGGMAKCGSCQRPLGATKNIFETPDLPNKTFCDEACGATVYRNMYGTEMPTIAKKAKR